MNIIKIGHYTLAGTIGKGGTSTIYKAYDDRVDRYVAIKMLHQHFLNDEILHSSFVREAQIIASVEHNAVVPIYDFGEHADQPYIVMRFMKGGTLRERMQSKNGLPLEQIELILTRICSALDKVHAYGVIHRDLKPSNILFDEEDNPYLADFGLARLTELSLTSEGITGSPHYMSPEQARGQEVDQRTDVYQLGVILYEMATGQRPFKGETPDAVLYQHIHEPIPILSYDYEHLPLGLDDIIHRAMAKDKEERFYTAGEMGTAFTKIVKSSPTYGEVATFDPDITPYHHERTQKVPDPTGASSLLNNKLVLYGGGAVLALLLLMMLYWLSGFNEGTAVANTESTPTVSTISTTEAGINAAAEPTPAVNNADTVIEIATQAARPLNIGLTAADLQALGGGSGRIAYAAKRDNYFHLFVTDTDGQTELQLTSNTSDDYHPVWSPDGRQILYHAYQNGWQIFVLNVDGSGIAKITDQPSDDSFASWSPDGTKVIFHSNRNGDFDIFTMNPDGTDLTPLTNNDVDDLGPAWSPDGSQIAFHQTINGQKQIVVMDADGSNAQQLTSGRGEAVFPTWSPDGEMLAFYSTQTGGSHIFTIKKDGTELKQLTTENRNFYPTWSPNGEWIIYHSAIGGENRELWMVKADGSEFRRLTTTAEEERMPAWMP
ncbi:MAG: serine/threonine-protein kinase [Anaerolineales bacterium]|nr:serine/threonine-protein kinase [Anaerolineales bacterium]